MGKYSHLAWPMYAYAFLKVPDPSAKLPMGIESASTLVVCNQIAALVEPDLAVDDLRESDERLVRAVVDHDRVIQELFTITTVLPLRFGTVFLSEQHLMEHLHDRQAHYSAQLERLEGKAEYLVKLQPLPFPQDNPESETQTGRKYFLAKKQRYQAQTQYKQQQQQELDDYVERLRQQGLEVLQGEGDDEVERLYILGDRPQSADTMQPLPDQVEQYTTWQIAVGDPLPPYHFVS
ncbi:MAG: gas vesicle protein [Cyanothece sp. SIO2G6]|nr:gas vesicle protein [Cyanothece sp. SIO2G6]